jgi:tetratricopeptide (TPR) repeat protein
MFEKCRSFRLWFPFIALVSIVSVSLLNAQDETLADIKYKEDYDRIQSIVKTADIVKRLDKLSILYAERRDMDIKLRDYADNVFARDMEILAKQANYVAVRGLSERVLKLRPKFGEVYLYYGIALKNSKMLNEALIAFARGASIPNSLSVKSKQQLDIAYRSAHGGSMVGQDKLIKDAMKDLR